MSVKVKKFENDTIWVILINRPNDGNAIDLGMSHMLGIVLVYRSQVCLTNSHLHLVKAFEAFDECNIARVAILYGGEKTFCSGADLKGLCTDRQNRLCPTGHGPMVSVVGPFSSKASFGTQTSRSTLGPNPNGTIKALHCCNNRICSCGWIGAR
jgi:hypothetical protein